VSPASEANAVPYQYFISSFPIPLTLLHTEQCRSSKLQFSPSVASAGRNQVWAWPTFFKIIMASREMYWDAPFLKDDIL